MEQIFKGMFQTISRKSKEGTSEGERSSTKKVVVMDLIFFDFE